MTHGDIDEAANPTCRRGDAVDLLMIWLDGEQITADRDHAVPGSVGFKIVRIGVSDRMIHEEPAKVGHQTPLVLGKTRITPLGTLGTPCEQPAPASKA